MISTHIAIKSGAASRNAESAESFRCLQGKHASGLQAIQEAIGSQSLRHNFLHLLASIFGNEQNFFQFVIVNIN